MSRCHIADSIATHCNEPEVFGCWDCGLIVKYDDELIRVKTTCNDEQFVCEDCSENYELIKE